MGESGIYPERRRLLIIAAAATAALIFVGIVAAIVIPDVDNGASVAASSTSSIKTRTAALPPPGVAAPTTIQGLDLPCNEAPQVLLDTVNGGFLNGQHLENAQSVSLPRAMTMLGGDVYSTDGTRENSREAWLYDNGTLYSITSGARRSSLFADGRDVAGGDWPQYNDALANCVGRADAREPG